MICDVFQKAGLDKIRTDGMIAFACFECKMYDYNLYDDY